MMAQERANEELCMLAQQGDEEGCLQLLKQNRPYIVEQMTNIGFHYHPYWNEMIEWGEIGILSSIQDYNPSLGTQFVSRDFHDMLETLKIQHSMSRPHKPVDNCFIETFWKSMKVELGKTDLLSEQTYRMVIEYYVYYNNLRPHSTLNYTPPLAA